jgi:hypothetical protein
MPTFRLQRQQGIAERFAELANAPGVANVNPQRHFEMPREQGPAVSSNIATELQKLLGAQPDVATVHSPEQHSQVQVAKPDLFAASVAAVKSLNARDAAMNRPRMPAPKRFESDVKRSVWLQERGD